MTGRDEDFKFGFSTVHSAYCYRPSSVVCQSVCHLVSTAKTTEAIEMPFAFTTPMGPGKKLLNIARLNARYLLSYRLIC